MKLENPNDLPEMLISVRNSFVARAASMSLEPRGILSALVPLLPRGKPTMTQKSKWSEKNQDYLQNYCTNLLAGFNRVTKFESCRAIQIIALFPCKKGTSPWELMDVKPDASNIIKGVEDALIRLDQRISYPECIKFYAPEPGLFITLIQAE